MKKVTERAEDALELHEEERLIKSERLYFRIDDQTEEQAIENPLGVKRGLAVCSPAFGSC